MSTGIIIRAISQRQLVIAISGLVSGMGLAFLLHL